MDKENKLKRLTIILNEYSKYLKIYKSVKIEVITKDKLETNHQFIYKKTGKNGIEYEAVGNVLGVQDIPSTEFVKVTYFDCKLPDYESVFESIEFPIEKLDKRIEHYENKVKYLKDKTNETIQEKVNS